MTIYLLEINLLLALSDSMHVHHDAAHRWFAEIGKRAWATCPITENGYVRIVSHPNYPNRPGDVSTVLAILNLFCASKGHYFWAEDISLTTLLQPDVVVLATLDRHIPGKAVRGGLKALEVIDT